MGANGFDMQRPAFQKTRIERVDDRNADDVKTELYQNCSRRHKGTERELRFTTSDVLNAISQRLPEL